MVNLNINDKVIVKRDPDPNSETSLFVASLVLRGTLDYDKVYEIVYMGSDGDTVILKGVDRLILSCCFEKVVVMG